MTPYDIHPQTQLDQALKDAEAARVAHVSERATMVSEAAALSKRADALAADAHRANVERLRAQATAADLQQRHAFYTRQLAALPLAAHSVPRSQLQPAPTEAVFGGARVSGDGLAASEAGSSSTALIDAFKAMALSAAPRSPHVVTELPTSASPILSLVSATAGDSDDIVATLSAQAAAYHRIGSSARTGESANCDGGIVSSVAQRRALLRAEQTMRLFCLPFRTHTGVAVSAASASSASSPSNPLAASASAGASASTSATSNSANADSSADGEVWIEPALQWSTPALHSAVAAHVWRLHALNAELTRRAEAERRAAAVADDDRVCKVCFERAADTLLQPCNHLVACAPCAAALSGCALCRTVRGQYSE
jgi:hypothetical protein